MGGGHPNQLQRSPLQFPWCGIFKKVYHVGVNMHYIIWFDLVWWSPKSAAEVTIAMSLVWRFQKGISCRGKYALFGLVWFGGHPNQLQRSPLQCPWSVVFKKGISCRGKFAVFGLVWFGGHPNQLLRSPLQCPWSAIFKKVYHVGVNLQYLVWFGLEVTQISCRGHHCNVLGLAFSKRYIM